jgi:hypothetical protein
MVFNNKIQGFGNIQADVLCQYPMYSWQHCCIGIGVEDLDTTGTAPFYNGPTGYYFCITTLGAALLQGSNDGPTYITLSTLSYDPSANGYWTAMELVLYNNGTLYATLNNTEYSELYYHLSDFTAASNSYYALQTANGYGYFKNVMTFNVIEEDDVTSAPSKSPTVKPSTSPSTSPTSARPSRTPSLEPSVQPTVNLEPTFLPTSRPTSLPPTSHPSSCPSRQPTLQPTDQPSSLPSGQPTLQPTKQPSAYPSGQPTMHPTSLNETAIVCSAAALSEITEERVYEQCLTGQLNRISQLEEYINRVENLFGAYLEEVRYLQPTAPPTRSPTRRRRSRKPTSSPV